MPAAALGPGGTGFYGKLPDRGDFVQRRLPGTLVEPWDAWLRAGLAASRQQLGAAWERLYMTFPIWRFALAPGACGPDGALGILMPSVDSVGRHFPLSLIAPTGEQPPAGAAAAAAAWFHAVEALALGALDQDFDLDRWDAAVAATVPALPAPRAAAAAGHTALRLPIAPGSGPAQFCPGLLDAALPGHSLWWTDGSAAVAPFALVTPGLPEPATFSEFLGAAPRSTDLAGARVASTS